MLAVPESYFVFSEILALTTNIPSVADWRLLLVRPQAMSSMEERSVQKTYYGNSIPRTQ